MKKIFLIIIILVLIIIGVIAHYIISNIPPTSKTNGLIANLILLWTTVIAFISASVVIFSYIHTNEAFILSQKPFLLLGLNNNSIFYQNNSKNPFTDLTIKVSVKIQNTSINLDSLFSKKMYMSPSDSRNRTFKFKYELENKGVNMDFLEKNINSIELAISYEHTFNKKLNIVRVQEYKWNAENNQWNIK